jgi:hypothetical protein
VIGARTDRQYADQPDGRVAGSGSDRRLERASTMTRAASSSSVGEPLTTEMSTSASDITDLPQR